MKKYLKSEECEVFLKKVVVVVCSCMEPERKKYPKPRICLYYFTQRELIRFDTCVINLVRLHIMFEWKPEIGDILVDQRIMMVVIKLIAIIEKTDNFDYALTIGSIIRYTSEA